MNFLRVKFPNQGDHMPKFVRADPVYILCLKVSWFGWKIMHSHPSNTYPYCTDEWYKILRVSNLSGKLESLFPEEFKIVFISRIAFVGLEKDALFITGYLLWIYSEPLFICYQPSLWK